MEALHSFDSQEQIQHNPEKANEAIARDFDKTLADLSSPEYSTNDIQETINALSSNNPVIAERLSSFQEFNTTALEKMLDSYNEQIQECSIEDSELSGYFGMELNTYMELKEQLDGLGLNLENLMNDYKNHIEENLSGLPQEVKDKVITSIGIKIEELGNIVSELYRESNSEDFKNNRWIINSKLQEELGFVNNELLPSLEAYSKIKSGSEVPEKYNQIIFGEVDIDNITPYSRPGYRANPDYINMDFKLKEVEQLIGAKIDKDGDFVEAKFGLYTQSIFDMNKSADSNLMNDLGIQQIDASLLSPEDIKIEEQAMLYFMAAIAVQVGGEIFGGPVGMGIGAGIDLYDTFSSEETLLKIVQAAGLVNTDFKMEKTWVDNVLAGLGLIPGATQIIKGSKLAKYLDTIDPKAFEVAKQRIKEKLGIAENISKFSAEETQRLNMAENLLGRKLDSQEKNAIIEAHNYGEKVDGKYNLGDLKEKYSILSESGFDKADIRNLMEKGICGNDLEKVFGSAYEKYPYLADYKDVLGENLSIDDIVGVGTQAIIVKHPSDASLVVKIAQPGEKDDIIQEYNNHLKFYEIHKQGKKEGKISDNIKVPRVIEGEKEGYFYMEKVDGQSLYSVTFLDRYKGLLKNENPDYLKSLTDQQLREYLKSNYNKTDADLDMTIEDYSIDYLAELTGNGYRNRGPTDLSRALDYLKEQGIYHNDLHPGNVMLDKNGNIYIIDFGRIKIYNK